MKKFIIRLFIFFLLIVICDFIFGKSMNYIINNYVQWMQILKSYLKLKQILMIHTNAAKKM